MMRNTANNRSVSPLPLLLSSLAAAILLLARGSEAVRTYTDAKGDTFTLPDDKKGKIVTNVNGALSLFHLGTQINYIQRFLIVVSIETC